MKDIPFEIEVLYNALLVQQAIPERFHIYYRKWLRCYLDFCQKYDFNQLDKGSLPRFINKLKEKRQTDKQQKQAVDAISIYYEIQSANKRKRVILRNKNKTMSSKKLKFRT